MSQSRRKLRPGWRLSNLRQLAAAAFLAALAGVVVGCNRNPDPPPAQPAAGQPTAATDSGPQPQANGDQPGVPDLAKGDTGLRAGTEAAREQERAAGELKKAELALDTLADSRQKNGAALPPGPNFGPVTGQPAPGGLVAPTGLPPGSALSTAPIAPALGVGGPHPGAAQQFAGRSSVTKDRLLKAGGGVVGAPAPEAKPAAPANQPADAKALSDEYNRQNAEAYGVYRENEFRSPLVAPLSTFSADVNTASYSNVRRMLMQGQLPPRDAVFLAEFVNYFPYSYAQPKGEDPVAFALEMGPCPWNSKHHLLRVGVQARRLDPAQMPPRNLVFLIDTSGSMSSENRLPLVKKSLALLIERLTAKDMVSIVTYAGEAGVALGPTRGTEKETIKAAVERLGAGGSTNGEGGLKVAYEMARRTFLDGGVNRVILCTDGDFNVGVTGQGELVRMIEEQRRSKVFLTILGYGMGNYKDQTLKELANHGNGHHAYIDTLDEARKVFVEQGGALTCVAKDVKFQVEFNPRKVTAYRLVGYENRLLKDEDFRDDTKDAGELGSGHQVTVLYEVVPSGVKMDLPGVDPLKYQAAKEPPAGVADEWLTVKMRYKHPEAETSKELTPASLAGPAVAKDLSDDFRFAAAVASFGMLLRESKYRGVMTYAGVLEEAQGCVGADPNGHRKAFLELVKTARDLSTKPRVEGAPPPDGN